MIGNLVYAFCIFMTVWNGLIIVLNALNDSLESIGNLNIFLLSVGVTGIILHG